MASFSWALLESVSASLVPFSLTRRAKNPPLPPPCLLNSPPPLLLPTPKTNLSKIFISSYHAVTTTPGRLCKYYEVVVYLFLYKAFNTSAEYDPHAWLKLKFLHDFRLLDFRVYNHTFFCLITYLSAFI